VSNFDSQIKKTAEQFALDWLLVKAVCIKESGLDTWKVRFEPNWKYRDRPEFFAKKNNISLETEINCQKMSWGLMQVMGTVAHELGYYEDLTKLLQPSLGLFYGCKKLAALIKRHNDLPTSLAAYNAGSGNIKAGSGYAKSVISIYDELKKSEEKSV
jgi:hypothetical protein